MRRKVIISSILLSLLAGCLLIIIFSGNKEKKIEINNIEQNSNPYKYAEISAVIIPSEGNTFGYDIYVFGSVLIHQPSRPGLPGNKGFATEEDAIKIAELVIQKIRNNQMPPTVTIEELIKLGVVE